MKSPQRFIISGLSRLSVPPAQRLANYGEVIVLAKSEQRDSHYAHLLDSMGITVVYNDDPLQALSDCLDPHVSCMLALADDDKENFNAASRCYELKPETSVVLRSSDSTLADEFEQVEMGLNVRRAYDMSALAAPAFVALMLSDQEFVDTKMTMPFGLDQIPLCKLKIHKGSALRRKTPRQLREKLECAVVAHRGGDEKWHAGINDGHKLVAGDKIIIGGAQRDVFRVARRNSTRFPSKKRTSLKKRLSTSQWTISKFGMPLAAFLIFVASLLPRLPVADGTGGSSAKCRCVQTFRA
jgi:hypothetical protein